MTKPLQRISNSTTLKLAFQDWENIREKQTNLETGYIKIHFTRNEILFKCHTYRKCSSKRTRPLFDFRDFYFPEETNKRPFLLKNGVY